MVSVVTYPRRESWANIQTPDAHWHPSGVAGLSFGVPLEASVQEAALGDDVSARRRASSLIRVSAVGAVPPAAQWSGAAPTAAVQETAAPGDTSARRRASSLIRLGTTATGPAATAPVAAMRAPQLATAWAPEAAPSDGSSARRHSASPARAGAAGTAPAAAQLGAAAPEAAVQVLPFACGEHPQASPPSMCYPAFLTTTTSAPSPAPAATSVPGLVLAPPGCTVAAAPAMALHAPPGTAVLMPQQVEYGAYAHSPCNMATAQAAPGGGYMVVGVVPAVPAPTQVPALAQAQAQPIMLSSLLGGQTSAAMPAVAPRAPTNATTPAVAPSGLAQEVTTVMLRNIPQRYDREALIDVLDRSGFGGSYDFFYLPIDFHTTNSVGYAFINFISEAELTRFRAAYVGKKLSEESPKVCEVCDAKLQGKSRNVEFYRNSTVMGMDENYHPVLFENGVRVPFPKPTRPIGPVQRRPPRANPK